jgi:hypothetical protein
MPVHRRHSTQQERAMSPFFIRNSVAVLFGAVAAAATHAESFASSASSAGSASLGSVSDSITNSSRSSSRDTKTADGDYRVIDVAEPADRPGMLRLTLHAEAASDDSGDFMLTLPRQALGERGIAVGDVVSARNRPYGVEFARAGTVEANAEVAARVQREPFFLVLRDDWHRELDPRAVTL